MKRLALLLPLLALAAAPARAEDPATNAPVADLGALARQGLFERIIRDFAIEWRDARITDVAEFLGDVSRSQMYMEHGANNAGIPFFVAPYAGENSFRTNEEPRVSFAVAEEAGNIFSPAELSKLAAEAAGMHLSIHPDCVIIHGAYEEATLAHQLFELPAGFRAAVAREPFDGHPADEGARLRAFFAARGVEWPDGSLVEPIPSNEWAVLKVIQTSEHLNRIGEILAAPGFSIRKVSLRPRLLAFEGGRAPDGLPDLPRPDRRLLVRRIPAANVAAVAAAFENARRGAVVRDLGAFPGENGLSTRWDSRPPFRATEGNGFFDIPWEFPGASDHLDSEVGCEPKNESWRMVLSVWNGIRGWTPDERAAGVTLEVNPRFSSDGSALSLHYVLRSLSETPAGSAAPLAPPHGCAGDIELAPGDALLLGTLRAPVRPGEPPRFLALLLETSAPSPKDKTHAETVEPAPHADSEEDAE